VTLIALIIDDHAVVRSGVRSALQTIPGIEIYEAASQSEGHAQIARLNPDILIVDINLPDGSGLELVHWVRNISKETAIVVLTFNTEDEFLLTAMKSGASAYVNKAAPLTELVSAIRRALESPSSFSASEIAKAIERRSERYGLSVRELQVLAYLDSDLNTSEIAKALFITESTLKTHLTHIYRKMQVKNRYQAINAAKKASLL
jgi:DNA-binding NarL/FixJ family response regulator